MADKTDRESKDGLALVVGGLFVLALVFATYTYFNKSTNQLEMNEVSDTKDDEEKKGLGEKIKDFFTKDNDQKADLNGDGAKVTKEDELTPTKTSDETKESINGTWQATDYEQGDIKGDKYTVQSGDTLWEIAQARYGNGADWVKILNANASSIGYLPNGQQALIVPGQVLVLPS